MLVIVHVYLIWDSYPEFMYLSIYLSIYLSLYIYIYIYIYISTAAGGIRWERFMFLKMSDICNEL